jgi:hypothetical protein
MTLVPFDRPSDEDEVIVATSTLVSIGGHHVVKHAHIRWTIDILRLLQYCVGSTDSDFEQLRGPAGGLWLLRIALPSFLLQTGTIIRGPHLRL